MSCCGTFSSVSVAPVSNPAHHVHFSTGMVLGVDDYAQEFSYHSARDKWLMRELGGYGTLSGLAVTVEDGGAPGPQVKVTAGSAAAPSGQMICVASEQCGSLNAWLQREDISARVDAMGAETAPDNEARLKVWLTLCYTSCAIAPVPIPGQPCRSEEDLMAPSRVADDYVLSLSLDPPPMTEVRALELVEIYLGSLVGDAAAALTVPQMRTLRGRIAGQLDAMFAPNPAALSGVAFEALHYFPDQFPQLLRFIRNHWITRLRPHVMAQRCHAPSVSANDCVLLSTFTVPVINPGGQWAVSGAIGDIDQDESDRPMMMSSAMAGSAIGIKDTRPPTGKTVNFATATGVLAAETGVALVSSAAAATMTLPAAGPTTVQQQIFVRNIGAGAVTLAPAAATGRIGGTATFELLTAASVMLVSDGGGSWRLLGQSV
jgi:hypothetical protein